MVVEFAEEATPQPRKKVKKKSIRLQIVEQLGSKCAWHGCDVTDPDMLQIDHVNGDGNYERRMFSRPRATLVYAHQNGTRTPGDSTYYKHMLNNVNTGHYQLLCANHNSKKHAIERRCKKYKGVSSCPFEELGVSLEIYQWMTTNAAWLSSLGLRVELNQAS